jgi:hypothetical protein
MRTGSQKRQDFFKTFPKGFRHQRGSFIGGPQCRRIHIRKIMLPTRSAVGLSNTAL